MTIFEHCRMRTECMSCGNRSIGFELDIPQPRFTFVVKGGEYIYVMERIEDES